MAWQKIANRYYDVVDGKVIKATKDDDGVYHECGTMSIEDFKAGKMTDGNTIENFDKIKINLKPDVEVNDKTEVIEKI